MLVVGRLLKGEIESENISIIWRRSVLLPKYGFLLKLEVFET